MYCQTNVSMPLFTMVKPLQEYKCWCPPASLQRSSLIGGMMGVCLVFGWTALFMVGSAWAVGSWDYLHAVYGVM